MAAFVLCFGIEATAFQCPSGSRPVFGQGPGGSTSTMCQCPDGSFAGAYGCPVIQQYPQIPPGAVLCGVGYCGSDEKCSRDGQKCLRYGQFECGGDVCSLGEVCSRVGCIPHGTIACGAGYCNPGNKCTRSNTCAPEEISDGSLGQKVIDQLGRLGEFISSKGVTLSSATKLSNALDQTNSDSSIPALRVPSGFFDPYENQPTPTTQAPSSANPFSIPNFNTRNNIAPPSQSPPAPYQLPAPGELGTSPCTGFNSPNCRGTPSR